MAMIEIVTREGVRLLPLSSVLMVEERERDRMGPHGPARERYLLLHLIEPLCYHGGAMQWNLAVEGQENVARVLAALREWETGERRAA